MGSKWTHAICWACWERRTNERGENGREPGRVIDAPTETCCWCGRDTSFGIYTREDPTKVTRCDHERSQR